MTTLTVAMNLSLVDTASPQVKAFIETLGSLRNAVAAVSEKLTATAGGLGGIGGGSPTAESGLGRLSATIATVVAETQQLATNTLLSGKAMMDQAVAAAKVQGALGGVGNTIRQVVAENQQLAASSLLAGDAMLKQAVAAARARAAQFTGAIG